MSPDQLISPEYLAQQQAMHAAPRGYGQNGDKWAAEVMGAAARLGAETILDYGAGQGSLFRALTAAGAPAWVQQYDPAVDKISALPDPADLVVCTDVLEHIEEDRIDAVLDHLQALARKALFAVIATTPAGKILPDGRNAHILIRPPSWWLAQLAGRFGPPSLVPCREHKELAAVWPALAASGAGASA